MKLLFACMTILSLSLSVIARENDDSTVFHTALGAVIDSTENARYNIFGDIPGFTAARLARDTGTQVDILFLRNVEDGAQMMMVTVAKARAKQLTIDLGNRLETGAEKYFEKPLMPIEEKQWQQRSKRITVILHDGSRLNGACEKAHGDTMQFRTNSGLQIQVPSKDIAGIQVMAGEAIEGKFYRTDPNTSRLFFGPTGRPLKAGNGYFADYWVFFPTAAFGITDYFSLAGGMSLIPGADEQLLYLFPKITIGISESMGIGAGLMHLSIPEETGSFNMVYGVTTFGKATGGITFGAGVPLGENNGAVTILLVGGETQISNSAKLITENWIFVGDNEPLSMLSGGVRFFGDRMAVDLALITSPEAFKESEGFPFFPWVGFSVFWGK